MWPRPHFCFRSFHHNWSIINFIDTNLCDWQWTGRLLFIVLSFCSIISDDMTSQSIPRAIQSSWSQFNAAFHNFAGNARGPASASIIVSGFSVAFIERIFPRLYPYDLINFNAFARASNTDRVCMCMFICACVFSIYVKYFSNISSVLLWGLFEKDHARIE